MRGRCSVLREAFDLCSVNVVKLLRVLLTVVPRLFIMIMVFSTSVSVDTLEQIGNKLSDFCIKKYRHFAV